MPKTQNNTPAFLPLFWWVNRSMPQSYTCPFLATLAIIWMRMRGVTVGWTPATMNSLGEWEEVAHVTRINAQGIRFSGVPCKIPARWILAECAFWNSRVGSKWRSKHSRNWRFA